MSCFGGRINGIGGFINISQGAKKVIFTGTFTASGLREKCDDGKLTILQEGKFKKIKKQVEQISFSGEVASKKGQQVLFVTERAVFKLKNGKVVLTEIAPGVDLERDILAHMEFVPEISESLKEMDSHFYEDIPYPFA